jgi:hypothetical protein
MAENEELDVFRNKRWRSFVNVLRGAASLQDETVLREFDRCFVPSLRRVFRLLKVEALISAGIKGDLVEVERLRREHHQQRDRAETFCEQVIKECKPGMSYREGVDAFVHGACARIIDQAALAVVPSDNFPTIEDYRQASAIWLFRMEPRINRLVDQIVKDPAALRLERESGKARQQRLDQQLGWSLLDHRATDEEA